MALTQRSGALAGAGQSTARSAANVANLARAETLQFQRPSAPAVFRPAPAPIAQAHNISYGGGGSAAAAQQILNRAVQFNRTAQPNVLQNAAKQSVLTALAVASGAPQPGRSVPQSLQLQQRMASGPAGRYDQQIQTTNAPANVPTWTDPAYPAHRDAMNRDLTAMQTDPMMPIQDPRIQQEIQALQHYPQMTA
jgi:hypothetical protein